MCYKVLTKLAHPLSDVGWDFRVKIAEIDRVLPQKHKSYPKIWKVKKGSKKPHEFTTFSLFFKRGNHAPPMSRPYAVATLRPHRSLPSMCTCKPRRIGLPKRDVALASSVPIEHFGRNVKQTRFFRFSEFKAPKQGALDTRIHLPAAPEEDPQPAPASPQSGEVRDVTEVSSPCWTEVREWDFPLKDFIRADSAYDDAFISRAEYGVPDNIVIDFMPPSTFTDDSGTRWGWCDLKRDQLSPNQRYKVVGGYLYVACSPVKYEVLQSQGPNCW